MHLKGATGHQGALRSTKEHRRARGTKALTEALKQEEEHAEEEEEEEEHSVSRSNKKVYWTYILD